MARYSQSLQPNAQLRVFPARKVDIEETGIQEQRTA
jgi:hypothetical protein